MKVIYNKTNLLSRRKELRNKSTPQEILLWIRLKKSQFGVKFRRQHSVGNYIADFYCPSHKLIIEIDGSQHFEKENMKYDLIRTDYFKAFGLRVLRFTNSDININMEGVILMIQDALVTTPNPLLRKEGSKIQ